jgi:predicted transcriptional regulator
METEEIDQLEESINQGLEDVKNGRVTPNEVVMEEIKRKYIYERSEKAGEENKKQS